MNIKLLIAMVVTASISTPLLADDDDGERPAQWRGGLYFVGDDDRHDDYRERIKEEQKWRDEIDKRQRERAREWEKRERERIKELKKLEDKRREEWEKYQRERAKDLREAPWAVGEFRDHERDHVGEREGYWRYQRRDPRQALPSPPYKPHVRDRDPWFEDDFEEGVFEYQGPDFDHPWHGDRRFYRDWSRPDGAHRPHFGGYYYRPGHNRHIDDDDDDGDDD